MSDNSSLPDALNDNAGVIGFGIGTADLRNQARAQAGIEELNRTLKQRFKEEEENKAKLLNAKETLYQFISRLEKCTGIESFPLRYLIFYKLYIEWISENISSKSFDEIKDKLQFESFSNEISNVHTLFEAYEDKNILEATKTLIDYCNLVRAINILIARENDICILNNEITSTTIPSCYSFLSVNPARKYTILSIICVVIALYFFATWFAEKDASPPYVSVWGIIMSFFFITFALQNATNLRQKKLKNLHNKQLLLNNNIRIRKIFQDLINSYDYIESETKRLFCKDDLLEKSEICFLDEIVQYRDQLALSLGISDSFISDYVT